MKREMLVMLQKITLASLLLLLAPLKLMSTLIWSIIGLMVFAFTLLLATAVCLFATPVTTWKWLLTRLETTSYASLVLATLLIYSPLLTIAIFMCQCHMML